MPRLAGTILGATLGAALIAVTTPRAGAAAVGIFIAGLLLRNGLGAESMAWTIMFLFLPLTCVYYPVAVLPGWLQYFAWALPPTYVFEGMRALLIDHVFRGDLMIVAFALNIVLFAAASLAFLMLLRSARVQGSLLQTSE